MRVAHHVDDGPTDSSRVYGHRWPFRKHLHEPVEPPDDRRVGSVPETLAVPDVVGVLLPFFKDRDRREVSRLTEIDAHHELHCSDSDIGSMSSRKTSPEGRD